MKKYLHLMAGGGRPHAKDPGPASAAATLQAPAGVRFIPGEDVLLLVVTLPRMTAAQRSAAVAFAVEERIARPLDEVQVAIGPELGANQWLVGVVDRAALPADTKPGQRILPDTLALPIPGPGHWAVLEADSRILIRLPDGTGFVTQAHALPVLHQIADAPAITLYAGQIEIDHTKAALPPMALPARFDLTDRLGKTFVIPRYARHLIAIGTVAALGHLAILSADTLGLSRQQAALGAQLRAASGASAETGTDAIVAGILAPKPAPSEAGFLPLLSATFAAMSEHAGTVSLRDLRYAAAQDSLTLTLQAADLGTLQQVETDLATASLAVTSGPATSAKGAAEQQLTVQGPPP